MTTPSTETTTEQQTGTRVQQWVTSIQNEAESDLGEQLGTLFQYFIDHVDEYDNGELYPDDLPDVLPATELVYVWTSVAFGTRLAADTALYVLTDGTNRFIGVYGIEENALDRSEDNPELTVTEHELTGNDPEGYVQWARLREEETLGELADSLEYIYDNRDRFINGHVDGEELPHSSAYASQLIEMSALFGVLWEYSYPSIYVILGDNNEFHGLFPHEHTAENHLDIVREHDAAAYVQRASVADGDLDPEQVID